MTTAAQQKEADAVEEVYRWAILTVGLSAAAEVASLHDEGSVLDSQRALGSFRKATERLVRIRRSWLVDLVIAYYRLVRALRTGRTVSAPGLRNENVSLEDLRAEFDDIVDQIEAHAGSLPKSSNWRARTIAYEERPDWDESANAPVEVDDYDIDYDEIESILTEEQDDSLDTLFDEVIPAVIKKDAGEADPEAPVKDADAERADKRKKRGHMLDQSIENITLSFARGKAVSVAYADRNAIGWVRMHRDGEDDPCGFCAMLLSRGFVKKRPGGREPGLYTSRHTAVGATSDESYHNGCHCIPVPVFNKGQLDSPLFDINRQYAEEWPKVTDGLSGKAAMKAWRKHIRSKSNPDAALEAA